jgi:hypothetical protein
VSDLNKKIYVTIEVRRNRPIEGEHPYVYLDELGRTSYRRATSATLASGLKLASSAASQPTSTAIAAPGRTEPQLLLQAVIEGWSPGRRPCDFCNDQKIFFARRTSAHLFCSHVTRLQLG